MNERETYLSFGALCDKLLQSHNVDEDTFQALKDVANSIGMRYNLLDELTTVSSFYGEADDRWYSYTNPVYSLFTDIADDVKKNPWKYPERTTT